MYFALVLFAPKSHMRSEEWSLFLPEERTRCETSTTIVFLFSVAVSVVMKSQHVLAPQAWKQLGAKCSQPMQKTRKGTQRPKLLSRSSTTVAVDDIDDLDHTNRTR